ISTLLVSFPAPSLTETYTLSLHDALPISVAIAARQLALRYLRVEQDLDVHLDVGGVDAGGAVDEVGIEAAPGERVLDAPALRERSAEHTSELQSQSNLVCRLLLEKKKKIQ